ncbi:MAG: WG repeat-containing protein [Rikenellaceae bacterium]
MIPYRDLYSIYLNPDDYILEIGGEGEYLNLGSCIFRNDSFREYFEFRFQLSSGMLYSLIIPLSESFAAHLEGVYDEIRRFNTNLFGEFSYGDHIIYQRENMAERNGVTELRVNMAIHKIVAATPFSEYVGSSYRSRDQITALYSSISKLGSYLNHRCVQLGHHTEHDYAVGSDGVIYICNATRIRFNTNPNNTESINRLCHWVEYIRGVELTLPLCDDETCGYSYNRELYPGHLDVGIFIQQRAYVRDVSGCGFIDERNRAVVAPIYDWCRDFREGRSVVCRDGRCGVIDLYGEVVIECGYDEVILLDSCSVIAVRQGCEWAYFSYVGRQSTPFAERSVDYTLRGSDLHLLDDYIELE